MRETRDPMAAARGVRTFAPGEPPFTSFDRRPGHTDLTARPRIKRIYAPPAGDDGVRVLVDRLWPRGLSKREAMIDEWLKEAAPSAGLRKWVHEDRTRWLEFKIRYQAELDADPSKLGRLFELAAAGPVTLLYAAADEVQNHAAVLQAYLAARM